MMGAMSAKVSLICVTSIIEGLYLDQFTYKLKKLEYCKQHIVSVAKIVPYCKDLLKTYFLQMTI